VLSKPPTLAQIERIVDRQMEDLRRDELVVTWREEQQAAARPKALPGPTPSAPRPDDGGR
jgi:hypothetical protein